MNFSGIRNHSLVGRLLRAPLRVIPRSTVLPILQGPLRGKRWISGSSSHGCWLGSYEFEKQQLFIKHVQPGDVVYDIGAHVGFYTLLSSQLVGPTGSVLSFEPLPHNIEYLKRHVALNNLTNVQIHEKAVSNETGQATFEISESSSMGHISDKQRGNNTITVETISLDEYVEAKNLPIPALMKIDIEGAERDLILGARNMLSQHRIVMFLATHGSDVHRACLELLGEMGYRVSSLTEEPVELTSEVLAIKPD